MIRALFWLSYSDMRLSLARHMCKNNGVTQQFRWTTLISNLTKPNTLISVVLMHQPSSKLIKMRSGVNYAENRGFMSHMSAYLFQKEQSCFVDFDPRDNLMYAHKHI